MTESKLARVVDPSALDSADGPCARARIELPLRWLSTGAAFTFVSPAVLTCSRCDGGGCDRCNRSGGLRAPLDAAARVIRACVPAAAPEAGVAIRIPDPFGPECPIRQLVLEVLPGEHPSEGVVRIDEDDDALCAVGLDAPGPSRSWLFAIATLVAVALALLAHHYR